MVTSSAVRAGLLSATWAAVAALLLGACAPDDPAPATVAPTSSAAAPAAHGTPRPYSDVNPPPRHGGDFVVKVLALSRLAPNADGHPSRPNRTGREFWGEDVRTCLEPSAHRVSVGWRDWRAEGVGGHLYPARAAGSQPRRTPAYPLHRSLAPGQCVRGWWLITVPKGTAVRAIQFAPGGGPTLIEWPTMR